MQSKGIKNFVLKHSLKNSYYTILILQVRVPEHYRF